MLILASAIVLSSGAVNAASKEEKKGQRDLMCTATAALRQMNASTIQSTIAQAGPVKTAVACAGIGLAGGLAFDWVKDHIPAKYIFPAAGAAAGVALYYNQARIPEWYGEAKLALQIARQFTQQEREVLRLAMEAGHGQDDQKQRLVAFSSYGQSVLDQFKPATR